MIAAAWAGVTWRGVPSTKMNPRASAPASQQSRASSALVIPQILIRIISGVPQRELADLGGTGPRSHEPLAHQDRVRARRHDPLDILAREDAALAHGDMTGRHERPGGPGGR